MADVVVLGSGMVGMATAMLLARDGHHVTVLERDPQPPPATVDEIASDWVRRGVTQFHQAHYFTPRMRQELERELPEVLDQALAFGARRMNPILASAPMTGIVAQPGDERFETVTGRRPVMEAAFAHVAERTDHLDIRRGVAVAGLLAEPGPDGVPHVTGVRTESGEDVRADLVVDATGRRSPLPKWLAELGGPAPAEEMEDVGFAYYGRHFRGAELPEMRAALLSLYPTNSILTLPCDNDTWAVGFIVLGNDAPMRALLDTDTWMNVLAAFPGVAHWIDAEPVDPKVMTMSKMEDRVRNLVVDGRPVVTGLLSVGDSWACSNPSLGRGCSIGVLHAIALRDAVRDAGVADGTDLALAFAATTAAGPQPWLEATLEMDRGRKVEIEAAIAGVELEIDVPTEMAKAFLASANADADQMRQFGEVAAMLTLADEVVSRPGVMDKAIELGMDWRNMQPPGPSRDELLELLGSGGRR